MCVKPFLKICQKKKYISTWIKESLDQIHL